METVKQDGFFQILGFLRFNDNKNELGKTDENCDRLKKMRNIFDNLSDGYAKYYSPTEHLAVGEAFMLFKSRIFFKHCILKKCKQFGMKIYKLCDCK
jgi:hypothetical protein